MAGQDRTGHGRAVADSKTGQGKASHDGAGQNMVGAATRLGQGSGSTGQGRAGASAGAGVVQGTTEHGMSGRRWAGRGVRGSAKGNPLDNTGKDDRHCGLRDGAEVMTGQGKG